MIHVMTVTSWLASFFVFVFSTSNLKRWIPAIC